MLQEYSKCKDKDYFLYDLIDEERVLLKERENYFISFFKILFKFLETYF
uniref:Uncharacterized protein n=1 Tax=viral metagenome TaxID=1070528 RepID=A0A6C0ADG7_9ZZZZ